MFHLQSIMPYCHNFSPSPDQLFIIQPLLIKINEMIGVGNALHHHSLNIEVDIIIQDIHCGGGKMIDTNKEEMFKNC